MIGLLMYVNTYVIKGADESLIIDAGPDLFLSRIMLRRNLRRIKVDLKRSIFLATHLHADHFGLIERFADGSKVYMGRREVDSLFKGEEIKDVLSFAVENGFPEHRAAITARLMFRSRPREPLDLVPLRDGDVIEVSDYKFKCIETPGHTRGHICLHDLDRRVFISGDHILGDITPNISSWSYEEDVLGTYLSSLKRTYEVDARFVLPGHGKIFTGMRKRIVELMNHYKCRLLEIVSILSRRSGDAYWITSKIKWKTRHPFWNRMLNVQEWLAFGETLACLNLLVKLGVIERRMLRNKTLYSVTNADATEKLNIYFQDFITPTTQ